MAGDDSSDPDPHAWAAGPVDPLDEHLTLDHTGVASLRAAADLLDAGDPVGACEAAVRARAHGVPVELVPYLAIVDGVAAILSGDAARAQVVVGDAWRSHPDVAALPAVLGAARLVTGEDAASAAHSMYAALVSDDPDRSLAVHRRRLTMLLAAIRRDA